MDSDNTSWPDTFNDGFRIDAFRIRISIHKSIAYCVENPTECCTRAASTPRRGPRDARGAIPTATKWPGADPCVQILVGFHHGGAVSRLERVHPAAGNPPQTGCDLAFDPTNSFQEDELINKSINHSLNR